jgi:hypothetical protein
MRIAELTLTDEEKKTHTSTLNLITEPKARSYASRRGRPSATTTERRV